MTTAKIQVTILGDSSAPSCEGDCGINWLKPEHQASAIKELAARFGDEVRVKFVDISAVLKKSEDRKLVQRVRQENLALLALLINGNTRIPGNFDLRMLLDIVDAETEREL